MLLQSGRDRENIWVENDVVSREASTFRQQIINATANFDSAFKGVSLTAFIECHHDRGCAVTPDQARLSQKLVFAVFERN